MKIFKNVSAYFAIVAAFVSLTIPLMAPVTVQAQLASGYAYCFNNNLGEGHPMSSSDAAALSTILQGQGFWTSNAGITTYNDVVASAVSGFQEKYASIILTPYGLTHGTGYVGRSTRSELNLLAGCSSGSTTTTTYPTTTTQSTQCPAGYTCTPINQTQAPVCPSGYTCIPVTTNPTTPIQQPINPSQPTGNGQISLLVDTSSSGAVAGSYQVNFSFTGGTATQPVSSWILTIQCPVGMDVNTVPGTSCNEPFQMGNNGQNYGNVSEKPFWFQNNTGSTQTVTATLQGYANSNALIGSSQVSIQIPSTGSGPISDSAVTVVSPNGGEVYQAGQTIPIQWTTSTIPAGGYIRVMLLQGNANQLLLDNLPDTGSVNMTLPTTASGNNYYITVQYISSTISSGDTSDQPFTIQPITQTNPTQQTCPSGQTYNSSWGSCTVQVQSNSGQPYVSIISPNGGETYSPGQTVPISFSTNLTSQQAPNGFNIWAYYGGNSTNVGSYESGTQNIAMSYTGGSPYNWTIPSSLAAGNYVIYVVPANTVGVSNTGLFAFGNSYFTISGQTTQTPICSSGQTWNGSSCVTTQPFSFNLVSPSTINSGQEVTFAWTIPSNDTSPSLYLSCPSNVTGTTAGINICNQSYPVLPTSTGASVILTNSGTAGSQVIPTFNYTQNGVGEGSVQQTITVNPSVSIPPPPTNPLISVTGTPTITKVNITSGGSSATTFQYTANFNLQLQAGSNSLTLGLPNSSFPAVGATSNYIQVIKNGAPDSTNDGAVISYSQPSNTTILNGNSFTIAPNQTATMPVSVSFTITNPGANVYGVQLNGVGYSSGSQTNQIYTLSGAQTSMAMTPTQGVMTASVMDALNQWLLNQ